MIPGWSDERPAERHHLAVGRSSVSDRIAAGPQEVANPRAGGTLGRLAVAS
jgi:hypothetical protein